MIEVKNLVKRYGDRNVVDHLSFTVEKGQIVGFLGPNGAGKSTTMNIITGYISPTEGAVTVNGYDIYDEPEKVKASIGYLPEQPPLYPDMKVGEYLNFVSNLKGVKSSAKEKSVRKVMRATKIQDVSERLIKHLSKGYKQRVGLAGAMIGDPEILILDEPINGLDPAGIKEIRDIIIALNNEGVTFIISSHLLDELAKVVTHYGIIADGSLIEEVSAKKLNDRCRKYVKITTNDNNFALALLRERLPDISEELRSDGLFLSNYLDQTPNMNKYLIGNGVAVSEIALFESGFEEYFIERLGR